MNRNLQKENKDATQTVIEGNKGIDVMEGAFGEIPIGVVPESLSERALKKRKEAEEKFGPNIPTGGELLSSFRPSKESTLKTEMENSINLEKNNSESSVDNKNTNQNTKEQSSSFSGVTTSAPKSSQSSEYNPTQYLLPCYPMTYPERGCFIVFCQENFDLYNKEVENKQRIATMFNRGKDVDMIELMARDLGFEYVKTVKDYTKEEINDLIKRLSEADHSSYDCFGCAVLTKGDSGDILYVRDGTMKQTDFTRPFGADSCPSLAGKPKLFFFDANRGSQLDCGSVMHLKQDESSPVNQVLISKSLIDQKPTFSLGSSSSQQHRGEKSASEFSASNQSLVFSSHSSKIKINDEIDIAEIEIPNEADFFIAHSTCPGYCSFRNRSNGSIFIQCLHTVFIKHGDSMELMQLITLVNNMIAYDFKTFSSIDLFDNKKQMSSITTTLTAEVYFAPKISIH